MRKIAANLKKDTLLLVTRKKYLYLFILLPLIIATLFIFILQPKAYSIDVGICDFDKTDISSQSFENLKDFNPIILNETNCIENLQEKIRKGELDLGIEIGEGFSDNLENLKQSRLVVYHDNTDIAFSNLISWKVDQSLEPFKYQIIDNLNKEVNSKVSNARDGIEIALDLSLFSSSIENRFQKADKELMAVEEMTTEFLTNPIWIDSRPIYENGLEKDAGIIYIFPILALFIILMLSSTSIIYDQKTGFLTRIKTSSTITSYITSKLIFFTALTLIQFLIITIIFMATGAKYALPLLGLLNLILFIAIANTLLGLLIGLISKTEGIAVLFSLMISFPLMLISGVFFPTQALPKLVQWISKIMPLHHQIAATKQVLLFANQIPITWVYLSIPLTLLTYYLAKKE